jgi:hypothetical protein
VATPERIESSQRLSRAATAEVARLQKALTRLEEKEAILRRQLAEIETEAQSIRQRLALVGPLAGDREPLARRASDADETVVELSSLTEPPHGFLRGAAIRIVAVRLLASTDMAASGIHYVEWLQLLEDAGYGIRSHDPAAAFLTQIGRSPTVARADSPGVYVLDLDAPRRLRSQLESLSQELMALHNGQQTIEAITSTRDRRAQLVTEIGRVERALEEAIESLGNDPTSTN